MEIHFKRFLLLFLPTFFILGFYPGVYFYFNHQDDLYTWYMGDSTSSASAIIFSGFMNFGLILFSIILAALYSFLAGYYLNKQTVKSGKRLLILNAIALTVFLAFLYLLYHLLALIGMSSELLNRKLDEVTRQAIGLAICYFIIALIISFFYFRLKQKKIDDEKRLSAAEDEL